MATVLPSESPVKSCDFHPLIPIVCVPFSIGHFPSSHLGAKPEDNMLVLKKDPFGFSSSTFGMQSAESGSSPGPERLLPRGASNSSHADAEDIKNAESVSELDQWEEDNAGDSEAGPSFHYDASEVAFEMNSSSPSPRRRQVREEKLHGDERKQETTTMHSGAFSSLHYPSSASVSAPSLSSSGAVARDPTQLPEEILLHVLGFCDLGSLCNMSALNHHLSQLSNTSALWKACYFSKWKQLSHDEINRSLRDEWKAIMIKRVLLEKNWRLGRAVELESEGHDQAVMCMHLNRSTVVTGSRDKTLGVFETETGSCRHKLEGHTSWVRCVQSDEWKAASGSSDRTIRLWNLSTGQCLSTLSGHDGSVCCLEYDDSGLISGAADQTVRAWDMSTGQNTRMMQGHIGPVRVVRQLSGGMVLSAGTDRSIRLWDLRAPLEEVQTMLGHSRRIDQLDLQDQLLVSTSKAGNEIMVWDLRQGSRVREIVTAGMNTVQITKDLIASGHEDGLVRLWQLRTGELSQTLRGHEDAVTCLQMDQQKIVTGSRDATVRFWDLQSGQELNRLEHHRGYPTCLAYNQSKLVLGTSLNGVLVYDFSIANTSSSLRSDYSGSDDDDSVCSSFCLPSSLASSSSSSSSLLRRSSRRIRSKALNRRSLNFNLNHIQQQPLLMPSSPH